MNMEASTVTAEEMFVFDLNGYIVIRGALNKEEVNQLNEAINANSDQVKERDESVSNTKKDTPMAGEQGKGSFYYLNFCFAFWMVN